MSSTYVEDDPAFSLAQNAADYLEFDVVQSDFDAAEPDDVDGLTFTLKMALEGTPTTIALIKTATAVGALIRFEFAPGDLVTVGNYFATVWDVAAERPLAPARFVIPVLDTVGGPL